MSTFQQMPNSGSLFRNERKVTDKHPDYTGSILVEGKEFWISGWIKKSAAGKTFMSLAVNPKEPREPLPPRDDDDLPF